MNKLNGIASDLLESRPPDFMTSNDFHEAPLEHRHIQRSVAVNRHGFIVERSVACNLRMEPNLFLRERKGCWFARRPLAYRILLRQSARLLALEKFVQQAALRF